MISHNRCPRNTVGVNSLYSLLICALRPGIVAGKNDQIGLGLVYKLVNDLPSSFSLVGICLPLFKLYIRQAENYKVFVGILFNSLSIILGVSLFRRPVFKIIIFTVNKLCPHGTENLTQ